MWAITWRVWATWLASAMNRCAPSSTPRGWPRTPRLPAAARPGLPGASFRWPRRPRSQQAPLAGDAVGFDAVGRAELADRLGQVVAHGAVGQAQALGDAGRGQAFAGQAQDLALALVERVGFGPGFQRQLRVDRAAAAVHGTQGLGQALRWGVLEQVAAHAGIQRA